MDMKTASVSNVSKRQYTKRGTTVLAKRVVLFDGKPIGRGRPKNDIKAKRTVVYIPVNETYNVNKHGTGVEYRSGRHVMIKRLKSDNSSINLNEVKVIQAEVKAESEVKSEVNSVV